MEKNINVKRMAEMGILIAIILIMALTPIGYLRIGTLEISLLAIPVAVGAILLGPGAGAALGLVFGLTSFAQCFGASPFGAFLLDQRPVQTFVICVLTRVLMGFLAGYIFRFLRKRAKVIAYAATGLAAAVLNTVLFLGLLWIFFCDMDALMTQTIQFGLGAVISTSALINGISEAVIGTVILGALRPVFRKFGQTEREE